MSAFGKRLREIRTEKDISLRQLAKDSGFDTAYISRVERGMMLPPAQADRLVNALHTEEAEALITLAEEERVTSNILAKTPGMLQLIRTIQSKKLTTLNLIDLMAYIHLNY